MRTLSILLLAVFTISCSTKKNIQRSSSDVKVSTETQKVQESTADSTKLIKQAVIITTEEDSGYTREVVEEITEYYMPMKKDSSGDTGVYPGFLKKNPDDSFDPILTGGKIPTAIIYTKRTIKEKGQKTTTTTSQANNSDSIHVKKEHQLQEIAKVDSTASHEELKKDVRRNGLNWYGWVVALLILLGLIFYFRPSLLKAWRWILYRLFGHKP